ncbi:MAG: LD-carboxypeptidase [Colwellia sp.]
MLRRNFFKTLLASTAIATILPSSYSQAKSTSTLLTAIKPKRLKSGDTIGLIAPSSNVRENEEITFATEVLKSFGFKVKHGKYLFDRYGYLAGQDKDRAWDVNNMFADTSIDGIFCLRGGYGAPRILPYLNYDLIAKNPKVFIGYSDVTALLNAIYARTGLVTFHGPIAKQNFTDYTLEHFKKILFNPIAPTELATPPAFEGREGLVDKDNRLRVLSKGKGSGVIRGIATGQLIGGNLSLLVKLVGTPYEPDYQGKILFLEEIEEAPYRIDGMLTHLWLAGRLQQLAGIVFGKCTDCEASSPPSLSIEQVFNDRLSHLGIPVLQGLMIGHIDDLSTIPVGSLATLDVNSKRLILQETAVL